VVASPAPREHGHQRAHRPAVHQPSLAGCPWQSPAQRESRHANAATNAPARREPVGATTAGETPSKDRPVTINALDQACSGVSSPIIELACRADQSLHSVCMT
jgi:hypothetical protein